MRATDVPQRTWSVGDRLSRDELQAYQARRLMKVMDSVLPQSPYWRRRFEDAGVEMTAVAHPRDLLSAPTLSKADYITALAESSEDYGGLLCRPLAEIHRAGAIVYHTTGTSGKQGRFLNTREGFGVFGEQGARLLWEAGARPGDVVMITFPLSFWAAGWGFQYAAQLLPCTLVPAGAPADTNMRVQLLQDYRPSVLVLTPSYALTLGRAAREAGVELSTLGIRGLLLGGEAFPPSRRERIEELWCLPGGTRNFYGISEGGPLFAVECEAQDGLHLSETDVVHQFWRPGGCEPAEPGELAEHVFTALRQRTMATWFNFRSRDGVTFSEEPCRCGQTSARMWVCERLDDMVKVKGVNVFASGVEELLSRIDGVGDEFRLVVTRAGERDALTLQIEVATEVDRGATTRLIQQRLHTAIGTTFDVEVLTPGTLPKTELKARRWLDLRSTD